MQQGDGQSAETGTALPINPAVRVTDGFGNPAAGVMITFTPGPASGTVAIPSVATNAQGIASSGTWVLGGIGNNTLVARLRASPEVRSPSLPPHWRERPQPLRQLAGTGRAGQREPHWRNHW